MSNIAFIIIALLVILYILYSIRKNSLSIATSFIWIVFCIILLVLSIWPKSLDWFAHLLGIEYPPALFLTIACVILFMIGFVQSKKIKNLEQKVIDMGQEISILKNTSDKGTKHDHRK